MNVGELRSWLNNPETELPDDMELRTTRTENGRPAYVNNVIIANGFFYMTTTETGEA